MLFHIVQPFIYWLELKPIVGQPFQVTVTRYKFSYHYPHFQICSVSQRNSLVVFAFLFDFGSMLKAICTYLELFSKSGEILKK